MAENYKILYEQTKNMLTKYQDEIVPGFRKLVEDLEKNRVDIVRCKECKYQYTGSMGTRFCQIWDKPNGYGDEGYCCYGERKNDG